MISLLTDDNDNWLISDETRYDWLIWDIIWGAQPNYPIHQTQIPRTSSYRPLLELEFLEEYRIVHIKQIHMVETLVIGQSKVVWNSPAFQ
jgi:hypothetical protein